MQIYPTKCEVVHQRKVTLNGGLIADVIIFAEVIENQWMDMIIHLDTQIFELSCN